MFGILAGRPMCPLTRQFYANGQILAVWIEGEIPCSVGNVAVEYTRAVADILRKNYVPLAVAREAFAILDRRNVRFDWDPRDLTYAPPNAPPMNGSGSGNSRHQQYHGLSAGEANRGTKYTFEEYERRYRLAITTNDINGAEAIIAAVLELLWGVAKGYGKTRQSSRHEKVAEWDEFNMAVDEALARAQTLRTHVRYLSREELNSFRDAPTPQSARGLSIRFAAGITNRNAPAARRTRK